MRNKASVNLALRLQMLPEQRKTAAVGVCSGIGVRHVVGDLAIRNDDFGASINHNAATIAAAAGSIGRASIAIDDAVGDRSKPSTVVGIEGRKPAALAIKDSVTEDGHIRYRQSSCACSTGIKIESATKSILEGAAISAVMPILNGEVGDADGGVSKRINILIEREHLVHAGGEAGSALNDGGAAAFTDDVQRVLYLQRTLIRGAMVAGISGARKGISSRRQQDGICSSCAVGFNDGLSQAALTCGSRRAGAGA